LFANEWFQNVAASKTAVDAYRALVLRAGIYGERMRCMKYMRASVVTKIMFSAAQYGHSIRRGDRVEGDDGEIDQTGDMAPTPL